MKYWQIKECIDILVWLNKTNKVTSKQKKFIVDILLRHENKHYSKKKLAEAYLLYTSRGFDFKLEITGLYKIAMCLSADELLKIGKILLFHGFILMCGIYGEQITTAKELSVDHIIAISEPGGYDKTRNLQFAHKKCNERKSNRKDFISSYDNEEFSAIYKYSRQYKLYKEQLKYKKKKDRRLVAHGSREETADILHASNGYRKNRKNGRPTYNHYGNPYPKHITRNHCGHGGR